MTASKYFNNSVFPLKLIKYIKHYIFKNKNSPKEKQLIRFDQIIIYKY